MSLNEANTKTGIQILTWREKEGELFSRLEIQKVHLSDGGNYYCNLPGNLHKTSVGMIKLHIVIESLEPVLNDASVYNIYLCFIVVLLSKL